MVSYRLQIILVLLMSLFLLRAEASSLPPEHEANRLMLAIESSVKSRNWLKAQEQLNALQSLKVNLPVTYYYFNGIVQAELNQVQTAQKSLEAYVVKADKEGAFYVQALEKLTLLEGAASQVPEEEVAAKATIKPAAQASGDGYVKSLQALYLTDDPIKALVLQINSLLSVHAYTGTRVKQNTAREGVVYRLSASDANLVLQEKAYRSGQPELRVNKLNVLGLDPFPKAACSSAELMCWIYHPGNNSDRWIVIDRDEMVLDELTQALSKLIRLMQK